MGIRFVLNTWKNRPHKENPRCFTHVPKQFYRNEFRWIAELQASQIAELGDHETGGHPAAKIGKVELPKTS